MTPSIWPSLIAFLVVIALIPLALALLKRAQGLRPNRQGMLNLVGGLSVGPRERIAVVETGGKWLVLGITSQSINLLTTLDENPAGTKPSATIDVKADLTTDATAHAISATQAAATAGAPPAAPASAHPMASTPSPVDVIASPFASLLAAMKKNVQHES